MSIAFLFKFHNTILAKYLMRDVLLFLAIIFVIISLLIFGNQFVLVIKKSITVSLPITEILILTMLKVLQNTSYILSLSLFLAIAIAFNNLYKNYEIVIMYSLGIGNSNFVVLLYPIIVTVFILVLLLTSYIAPWAAYKENIIINNYENFDKFFTIKAGEFQKLRDNNTVFYASKVSDLQKSGEQNLENIFIYSTLDDDVVITTARQAKQYTNPINNSIYLRLQDGARYYGFINKDNKKILNFDFYDFKISTKDSKKFIKKHININSKNTIDLLGSNELAQIAELQFRISQAINVLILSVLGVLLGGTYFKQGKNLGILIGVIFFILYNSVLLASKSWIEQGILNPLLGLWWVHLLAILIILVFHLCNSYKFLFYFDKMFIKYF